MIAPFRQKRDSMPTYPTIKVGDLSVNVAPHGFRLSQQKPFYNGDDIYFNIVIIAPFPKPKKLFLDPLIDRTFNITWDFFDRTQNKVIIPSTKDSYRIRNRKNKDKVKNSDKTLSWDPLGPTSERFTISKAIHIGKLWDFNRYDLRITNDDGSTDILAEFTLRDIDEHGENFHLLILNLLIGAIVSFFVAFITVIIFGRNL